MTTNDSDARWELLQVSIKDGSFTILDKLTKKRRIYHVPYLLHAELMQQAVYIYTSTSKIMQLNLQTATRHFVSATQLKYLSQIQKLHKSIYAKETAGKKPDRSFINMEHPAKYVFHNTVSSY